MGEEWGATTPFLYFSDHDEPELAEAVSRGRAREFGGHGWAELYGADIEVPDPQSRSTFEASRLDWAEARADGERRMLDLYRALIRLRHDEPAIASGDRRATAVRVEDGAVVMTRGAPGGGGLVDVVLALEDGPTSVVIEHDGEPPQLVLDSAAELGGDPAGVESRPGATHVTVRGPGVVVLRAQRTA
jgi:maltooligosyltrehalose trehalohydrolase